MIKFILSFICGYILHMAVKPKTDKMSGGWPNLTEQTMGMIGGIPVFLDVVESAAQRERPRPPAGRVLSGCAWVWPGGRCGIFFRETI